MLVGGDDLSLARPPSRFVKFNSFLALLVLGFEKGNYALLRKLKSTNVEGLRS